MRAALSLFERAPRVKADADAGRIARAVEVRGAADRGAAVAAAALCLCGSALVEGGFDSAWGGGCCRDGGGEGEGEERFELHFVLWGGGGFGEGESASVWYYGNFVSGIDVLLWYFGDLLCRFAIQKYVAFLLGGSRRG